MVAEWLFSFSDILHPKFWNLKIFHFLCAYWTTSSSVALPLKCSASSLDATLCVISTMGWIQPMATVAYQNAKRNSTVFRRLYTAYSFWTAGNMATHQIPFQDANQMAGFICHHTDMSLYEWHITQQRKGQSSSCIRKHYRWQMRWQ